MSIDQRIPANQTAANLIPAIYDRGAEMARLASDWAEHPRWRGVERTYTAADVVKLRGSIKRDNTIAKLGAHKLWNLLAGGRALIETAGAGNGDEAVRLVDAGTQAIYVSCSQAAADRATAETIRPDQSLYAINSVPSLVRRINNAFERADQIQWNTVADQAACVDYFAPIIADAAAPTDSTFNAFELIKNLIRAGAAAVRIDDHIQTQGANRVLMPTCEAVQKLSAARLAADVEDAPTLIIAATSACTTPLLSSDCDAVDAPFIAGERAEEECHPVRAGIDYAIARGLAYAPYADLLWLETATLDMEEARRFAQAIHREFPDRALAYTCRSTHGTADAMLEKHREELTALGYRFQTVAAVEMRGEWDECEELAA